jgi:Flp pilus assembly protein TadB
MNDKIINISSKALLLIIVVVGVVISSIIMSYGNPSFMNEEEVNALGMEMVKEGNLDPSQYTQEEINDIIRETGKTKKEELAIEQGDKVVTVTNFTLIVMVIAVFLILLGVVLGLISSPKEYVVGLIGAVVFVVLIVIIYNIAGTDVPNSLSTAEAAKLQPGQEALFTGDNWKLAGTAMLSMIVLIVIAAVSIVGSEVYKIVKG